MKSGVLASFIGLACALSPAIGAAAPPAGFLASPAKCSRLLGDVPHGDGQRSHDVTTPLTAYLGQLLDERVIGDEALARVLDSLRSGNLSRDKLIEDIIPQQTALENSAAAIQREGLEKLLTGMDFDPDTLREWVERSIKSREHVRESRKEASTETLSVFQPIVFNHVEPGEYLKYSQHMPTRIDKPFEMMSHLFTQWQWTMVMGDNPSDYSQGENEALVTINGSPIRMQPDHPVETVSYNDVTQKLIPRLNELAVQNDPLIYRIIPDFRPGDRFRLPTDDEWEFVFTSRGTMHSHFFWGDDLNLASQYVWIPSDWSSDKTHPVGVKLPLVVDGAKFYDLLGNVGEWVEDDVYIKPNQCTLRGFCPPSPYAEFQYGGRSRRSLDAAWGGTGFRLVRERAP